MNVPLKKKKKKKKIQDTWDSEIKVGISWQHRDLHKITRYSQSNVIFEHLNAPVWEHEVVLWQYK